MALSLYSITIYNHFSRILNAESLIIWASVQLLYLTKSQSEPILQTLLNLHGNVATKSVGDLMKPDLGADEAEIPKL